MPNSNAKPRGKSSGKPSAVRNSFDFLFPQTPGVEPLEGALFLLDIEVVHPTPGQPRTVFPPGARSELAANIRELRERGAGVGGTGILQPLLVRSDPSNPAGGYLITAGERRYWAARDAGAAHVPAIIREQSEAEAFEEALVENIQRHDLTPLELAEAYRRLMSEHGLSMREVARRVGKSASEISRALAIAKSPLLASAVESGDLTPSQAQEILPIPEHQQQEMVDLAAQRRREGQPLPLAELRRRVSQAKAPAKPLAEDAAPDSGVAVRNSSTDSEEPSTGVAVRNTQAAKDDADDAQAGVAVRNTFEERLRQVTHQLRELREAAAKRSGGNEGVAVILSELNEQEAAIEAIRSAVRMEAAPSTGRRTARKNT